MILSTANLRADVIPSGQITNLDGSEVYDWVTEIPSNDEILIARTGTASLTLNTGNSTNGLTNIYGREIYVGYGAHSTGSFTMTGAGTSLDRLDIDIAQGDHSRGTFTLAGGAQIIDPTSSNQHIQLGWGAGSLGKMIVKDPGTYIRLADLFWLGMVDGASGILTVENGGHCEAASYRVGYGLGGYGKIIVRGPGSMLNCYSNGQCVFGWSGDGYLIVEDGGFADLPDFILQYSQQCHGEATVTGAGSRIENHYAGIKVGRGSGTELPIRGGYLRAARGGVVVTDVALYVGYGSYRARGTLIFTIGDNGSGTVVPGRIDVSGPFYLDEASLEMETDSGISLTNGQVFTLVDYQTLGAGTSYTRFNEVAEGDVLVTSNFHAFRINYATDIGGGDLAITATVVDFPAGDGDSDSMEDEWEILHFGSADDPRALPQLDSDGDGWSNHAEHEAGTDPLDPQSHPRVKIETPAAGSWGVSFGPYEPGTNYVLEMSESGGTGSWSTLTPTSTTMSGGEISLNFDKPAAEHAIIRVKYNRQ